MVVVQDDMLTENKLKLLLEKICFPQMTNISTQIPRNNNNIKPFFLDTCVNIKERKLVS